MVTKKATTSAQGEAKLKLKKETINDLDMKRKAGQVKGGTLVGGIGVGPGRKQKGPTNPIATTLCIRP